VESAALARKAIEAATAVDARWIHAYALHVLGWVTEVADDAKDGDERKRLYEEGLAVARTVPEPLPFQVSALLESLAEIALREEDLERAEETVREAFSVLEPFGERYGLGFVLRTLGWVRYQKGDAGGARDAWLESLRASREVDDPWQMADSLAAFGRVALEAGKASLAARWIGAADALRERSGRRRYAYHDQFEQTVALVRARLGSPEFDAAWRSGIGLAPELIWAEIEGDELAEMRPSVPEAPPSGLTPREREILAFLAAGKTDREIAETIFVSVRTVEGHVGRILAKLGVRTRTAAARAALVAGLVAVETHRPTDRSR
jgi:DNA-binding CsgD family transcriptional regulator